MQVQIQCQCGAKYAFDEKQVGDSFRCSVCHQVFDVPPPGQKPILMKPGGPQPAPPSQFSPPQGRRGSGVTGCLLVLAVLVMILVAGGLMVGWIFASASSISRTFSNMESAEKVNMQLEHIANPKKTVKVFKNKGYRHVEAHIYNSSETVEQKTLYECQILSLNADSEEDIAIVSQSASLSGTIKGDVDFYGQSLTIAKDAVIEGDLNVGFAQIVVLKGKVKGSVSGTYKLIQGEENVEGEVIRKGQSESSSTNAASSAVTYRDTEKGE